MTTQRFTVSRAELEALKTVRNMAYDFNHAGNVVFDSDVKDDDCDSALYEQAECIDIVDAVLFRIMGIEVVDSEK